MSEGKKTYPNRDARSHNEPIRLEKIEKDVRELKNQVEEISKEADEFINLPESIEPHSAMAAGEDDEKESDLPNVLPQQRQGQEIWRQARHHGREVYIKRCFGMGRDRRPGGPLRRAGNLSGYF